MGCLRKLTTGLLLLCSVCGPALAQEKPAAPVQPDVTTATYQDWLVRCVVSADKIRTCEAVQNVEVQGQGVVATLAIGRIDGKGGLQLVAQVPAGVWLPEGVTFVANEKTVLKLEYKRCLQGCFAIKELDAAMLQTLRSATEKGSFSFQDGARRAITLPVSFKGLVPALDSSLKP